MWSGADPPASICAAALAERGREVLVLERGPRLGRDLMADRVSRNVPVVERSPLAQNHVVNRGRHEEPVLTENAVGGSSLIWWGHTPPLHPADFRLRSLYGVGVDWPIGFSELAPYLWRAEAELAVSGNASEVPWQPRPEYPLPGHPLSPHERMLGEAFSLAGLRLAGMPVARLSRAFAGRPACDGRKSCHLYCPSEAKYTALNTHVPRAEATGRARILPDTRANFLQSRAGVVRRLAAQSLDGSPIDVEAETYLLAANAVENARLLLNSRAMDPAFGGGAALGRYFMDHPNLEAYGTSSRDLQNDNDAPPSTGVCYDLYDGDFRSTRAAALLETMNAPRHTVGLSEDLMSIQRRQGGAGGDPWAEMARRRRSTFVLGCQLELLPSESNRIDLTSEQKDPFGWPCVAITYDGWSNYVDASAARARQAFDEVARHLGGEVRFQQRYESRHLMGGCRMGTSADDSVVDANLRSHQHRNLHVLGAGVFPTGGATNPTLLVAALSLRCADFVTGP